MTDQKKEKNDPLDPSTHEEKPGAESTKQNMHETEGTSESMKTPKNNVDTNEKEPQKRSDTTRTSFRRFLDGFDLVYEVTKRVFFVLVLILVLLLVFVGGTGAGYFASLVEGKEIPTFEDMRADISDISISSVMYYGSGELISNLRSDLKRSPISSENISPYIKEAIIATEDEYFYRHNGMVPKAIVRALYQEFSGSPNSSGGSTLTQQLIKQQLLTNEVSFDRKANEILLALRLEKTMDKDEILEAYLNVSPFGRNSQGKNIAGVEEAAKGLFGVSALDVTLPQAAFIAGLPQNPIGYTPYNQYGDFKENIDAGLNRQKDVLYRMFREEYISEEEYTNAKNYDIQADFLPPSEEDVRADQSYVYDAVEKEARQIIMEQLYTADGKTAEEIAEDPALYESYFEDADTKMRYSGYKITSTIDKQIHEAMEQVAFDNKEKLGLPKEVTWTDEDSGEVQTMTEYVQNGSVTLENATGRIVAFVGGIDYQLSQTNRALDTRRQPGSIIKPLVVYGPALENGILTPASISPDTEYSVPDGPGQRKNVTNAGPTTNEWMTAREALYRSQNIPTSKFYTELIKTVNPVSYLKKAGWGDDAITLEEFSRNSTALGGLNKGPTNLELSASFAAIANGGVYVKPYLIEKIETRSGELLYENEREEERVYTPETAFLLQDMLRDVLTKGTASDTRSALNFNADIISKTGTTNFTRDVWYVASTPDLTISSWLGYDNKIKHNGLNDKDFGTYSSKRNRLQWTRLVNKLYSINPTLLGASKRFTAPSGITQASVLASTGMKPGTVTLPNGTTSEASGDTFTEYFNKKFLPKTTSYDFAFGATETELAEFWGTQTKVEEKEEEIEEETDTDTENDDESKEETTTDKEKQEADKKAAEEKKKAEEAKQKAEEEKKKAAEEKKKEEEEEEEKKKQEEEKKKEEEEKKKKEEEEKKNNSTSGSN